jgi:hypothetical protein
MVLNTVPVEDRMYAGTSPMAPTIQLLSSTDQNKQYGSDQPGVLARVTGFDRYEEKLPIKLPPTCTFATVPKFLSGT